MTIDENNYVWQNIKGSHQLFEIYGYYPTFHDAIIRNININFEERIFSLTLDYSDLVEDSENTLSTRIEINWLKVQNADFKWYAEHLYGLEFSFKDDLIKTKFEDSSGFYGEVFASKIEVTNVKTTSEIDSNEKENLIKFSIS